MLNDVRPPYVVDVPQGFPPLSEIPGLRGYGDLQPRPDQRLGGDRTNERSVG